MSNNELQEQKEKIRKQYISIRNNVENKLEKSIKIKNKIINSEMYINSKVIALYKNLPSEVSTIELIEYSIRIGKMVVLPRVKEDNLEFYKIDNMKDKFIKSKFGVEEPVLNYSNLVHKEQIDLIIVPGVCFDKNKNRMGFGKGFYDRFLANSNLKSIGICFEEQIINDLVVSDNDVKMQYIITDQKVY